MKYHNSSTISQYLLKQHLPFGNGKGKYDDFITVGKMALDMI
jgi:hypothetical protein